MSNFPFCDKNFFNHKSDNKTSTTMWKNNVRFDLVVPHKVNDLIKNIRFEDRQTWNFNSAKKHIGGGCLPVRKGIAVWFDTYIQE